MFKTIYRMFNYLVRVRHHVIEQCRSVRFNFKIGAYPALLRPFLWLGKYLVLGVMFVFVFIIEIPIYLSRSQMASFQAMAKRDEQGRYLDSYTSHVRKLQRSIAIVMLAVAAVATQFYALGYSVWTLLRPSVAVASSSSTTITASYDVSTRIDVSDNITCELETATSLTVGFKSTPYWYKAHLQFSLSTIPNSATITKVEFVNYVSKSFTANDSVIVQSSDNLASEACDEKFSDQLHSYATGSWTTTGSKTTDLGSTAVSDAQARLSSSDLFSITVTYLNNDAYGTMNSMNNASNKPQLKVSYTLPPQAPTGFAHGDVTQSTVVWNWTDNATGETRYDVKDGSSGGSPVTGCSDLTENTQTCTETGLSANTQYTRHPNVTDADGNTDGSSASVYTTIETPSGIDYSSVEQNSIAVSASGSLSNLTSGSSGLYFEESETSTNSGWTQTNGWAKTGLSANTPYTFRVMARNGDSTDTEFSGTDTKYTLSPEANVSGTRSTGTWYAGGNFGFTNAAGWGRGGVEYYRYYWNRSSSYTFTGTEPTWSNSDGNCPGGDCTVASSTLNVTATSNSTHWYLHLLAYNHENAPNGSGEAKGPYYAEVSVPSGPQQIELGLEEGDFQPSENSLAAYWPAVTDVPSGIKRYEYAVGTAPGATDVVSFTDNDGSTSFVRDDLSLTSGVDYYVSVRVVSNVNQVSEPTVSGPITVSSQVEPTETLISNVAVAADKTSVTITWSTNEAASGVVSYGLTSGYGSSASEPGTATSHSVTISGLTTGTTYHYRVSSTGTTAATTADSTFTTKQADVVVTITAAAPVLRSVILPLGNSSYITPTGIARVGQTVQIFVDGKLYAAKKIKGKAGTAGSFYFKVKYTKLSAGKHTITIRAVDENGTASSETGRFTLKIGSQKNIYATSRTSKYVVKAGDSLWSIAERYLRSGRNYTKIIEANYKQFPALKNNARLVQPGWVINIPRS